MKKFGFFALLAAGLLLGACSSEINDENPKGGDYTDGAYIGISLQLPSAVSATRANEDFEDGEDDEFAVKDATLYLFQGDSEAAATYLAQYTIGTEFVKDQFDDTETDNAPNITSTYCEATQITTEVANKIKGSSKNVYAYVVVNNNAQIPALDETETFAAFSQRQFTAFGSPIAAKKNIGTTGLLMTSSPICDEKGGSAAAPTDAAKYRTLIIVDKDKIFHTAEEAKEAPAACIYVERAAAKITVSSAAKFPALDGSTKDIEFVGWQIINYEPKFYNTRQIEAAWGELATDAATPDTDFPLWSTVSAYNKYRFVSYAPFASHIPGYAAGYGEHTTGYRTYFAKDINYDNGVKLEKTVADLEGDWMVSGDHGYTTENTFDVEHMTFANTTQVTLKYKFNDGDDFYTLNGGNVIYDETGIENLLVSSITNLPTVFYLLDQAVTEASTASGISITGRIVVDITAPSASKDGVEYTPTFEIFNGTTSYLDNVTASTKTDLTNAITDAVNTFSVSFYKGGFAYYNARIKHFGDYETPWNSTKPFETVSPGETVQQIYGFGEATDKSSERFLGRYGVVRDNWYKLTVSGIKHIGTAEPVDVSAQTTIPDDEIDNFISIHVHILPWVIREQAIDL